MKAICKIYKGIEYVQLNELPLIQQDRLRAAHGDRLFIKILVDGKILSQCIQFKDYSSWYENAYRNERLLVLEPALPEADIQHSLAG